ncbi:NAD(P)-dependent alcohol dehydrogenase [Sorangium sp. So ce1151]|uniref:NAD(P)-dependent alcohol dehydrogenase n=1 Tax=Sorangium sp. So ce1151 TaxID=3133332 RepID=UPI003F60B7EB
MKAIVYTEYGPPDVLQLMEVKKPAPRDNAVMIRVCATTATAAEGTMRRGVPLWGRVILGLTRPTRKIMGLELAGEIKAVGKDVTRFRVGDRVYGFTGFGLGAYAEYVCMPEAGSLVVKPANLTYEEAAAVVDGASTAWTFLRDKANVQRGHKVLILGASGSIGTSAVQIAKHLGAEVVGVCSAANVELVKSLGADRVIDYTKEDFARNGDVYDVIFDAVAKSSFSHCRGSLAPEGIYLSTVFKLPLLFQWLWTSMVGGKRAMSTMSIEKTEALTLIRELIETGKLKPVIDRRYPLEQMAEAHRYVDTGRKKGSVVITVAHDASSGTAR